MRRKVSKLLAKVAKVTGSSMHDYRMAKKKWNSLPWKERYSYRKNMEGLINANVR